MRRKPVRSSCGTTGSAMPARIRRPQRLCWPSRIVSSRNSMCAMALGLRLDVAERLPLLEEPAVGDAHPPHDAGDAGPQRALDPHHLETEDLRVGIDAVAQTDTGGPVAARREPDGRDVWRGDRNAMRDVCRADLARHRSGEAGHL